MRQARRTASGVSPFSGHAALAVQGELRRDTGRAMSQENVEVVRQAFAAWNRGDIEGYIAHLCSDVECTSRWVLRWRARSGGATTRSVPGRETHPEVWETLLIWAEEFERVDEELLLVSGHWDAVGRSGVEMSDARDLGRSAFATARSRYWQAYTSRADALEAVGLSE